MTQENFEYRTNPLFLRNQFAGNGQFDIPLVPRFEEQVGDFADLRLIGFDRARKDDTRHIDRIVHFFLYDYKFERVWTSPYDSLERLRSYRAVLTPDFSMYLEMAPAVQLYNTFRNRWCGAYFASQGLRVVPTVNWGSENTFDFCFDGVEKGSVVAVSTYMASAHNNHADQKAFFLTGYNEMLRRIEPAKIICYHEPFPEMGGDIVYVNYELSSWMHMDDDKSYNPSPYAKYICGQAVPPPGSGLIIKGGEILKGSGSAHGGPWRPSPNKPEDERFLGTPGQVKETLMPNGEKYSTKIGPDGRAIMERHPSDHNRPWSHSEPHDHPIDWDPDRGNPLPGPPINYFDGDVPEFKTYEVKSMRNPIVIPPDDHQNFESISDFKWCVDCGGEVEFLWKGKAYSVTHPGGVIDIGEGYYLKDDVAYNAANHQPCSDRQGKQYRTADEALEHIIDGERLRDIVKKIKVVVRTI